MKAVQMFDVCRRMHAIDPFSLMCLDFLVTDYAEFVGMMLDFKNAFMWEEEQA